MPVDIVASAAGAATGGLGWIVPIASGILSALTSLGDSPREEKISEILDNLMKDPRFAQLPFSKDEIMKVIVPEIQRRYVGASDVAAGRIGAQIGESGQAGGQATSDLYMQALAPTIAAGQHKAADATQWGVDSFASMDNAMKERLLKTYQLSLQGASGLETMSPMQRAFSGFLSGGKIGMDAWGGYQQGKYYQDKNKP